MGCFAAIVVITWYISTRHGDKVRSIKAEFVKGRIAPDEPSS
jgi:hypothetical protein